MTTRFLLALLTGTLVATAGVGAQAADLTVSAASSLTNAFRAVVPAFEKANPGAGVQLNFASSGALLQQIAKGAPVDVFASADEATMNQAEAKGLVAAAGRKDFASNSLVVIVPAAGAQVPQALGELATPTYARITIGSPASVPVGRYTKGALEAAGLWLTIEPKMIRAENVRQALDYVARGEVDAGFVYASDAALMPDKVTVALKVPTTTPIRYPVAPVAGSPNADLARRFIEFLGAPTAGGILTKFGFDKP